MAKNSFDKFKLFKSKFVCYILVRYDGEIEMLHSRVPNTYFYKTLCVLGFV